MYLDDFGCPRICSLVTDLRQHVSSKQLTHQQKKRACISDGALHGKIIGEIPFLGHIWILSKVYCMFDF